MLVGSFQICSMKDNAMWQNVPVQSQTPDACTSPDGTPIVSKQKQKQ